MNIDKNDRNREQDIVVIIKQRYPNRNIQFRNSDHSHWYFGPAILSDVVVCDVSLQYINGPKEDRGVILIVDGLTDHISDHVIRPPTERPRSEYVVQFRRIHGLEKFKNTEL